VTVARSVEGVRGVESTVQVGSRSVGQSLDDKVIFSKIKGNLIKTPGIRSLNIDVDVYNGVVTLVGLVKTNAQKSQIIAIAKSVSGVIRVVSKLRVKP
jgi:hyperosmotically inducible protein